MSAIKIQQRRATQLTRWMGFHAGNVSNQNKAEEGHTTHNLDWISCRQCQQSISSRGGPYNSPAGWDFTQAMSESKSSRGGPPNSLPGWDFKQAMLALAINSMICWLPPVHNIQTSIFYQFNPYIISLQNSSSNYWPKLLLIHLHTKYCVNVAFYNRVM